MGEGGLHYGIGLISYPCHDLGNVFNCFLKFYFKLFEKCRQ